MHGFKLIAWPITAIWNKRDDGTPYVFKQAINQYGLVSKTGYFLKNLYTNQDYGFFRPDDVLSVKVAPSGVIFFKATPVIALRQAGDLDELPVADLEQ